MTAPSIPLAFRKVYRYRAGLFAAAAIVGGVFLGWQASQPTTSQPAIVASQTAIPANSGAAFAVKEADSSIDCTLDHIKKDSSPATTEQSSQGEPGNGFSFRLVRTADGCVKPVQYCDECWSCNGDCGDGSCGGPNGCQRPIYGVDCRNGSPCNEQGWHNWGPIPWQAFGPGEYVGPSRYSHVDVYQVRVDDQIEFIFRLTREATHGAYQLQVGDTLRIESIVDPNLSREVTVYPDGTISALHLGRIRAVGRNIDELKADLEDRYLHGGGYKIIDLTISLTKVNTKLEDLRAAVDSRFFTGGQGKLVRVSPEGTIRLPGINAVHAVGLTLDEIQMEINSRYAASVSGIEVTPILQERAPRFVYVLGEVRQAGRFTMDAPTSVMQSLSLAGGWNIGANLREVVVFRRGEDWRLLATKIDIRGAVYGKRPTPADEIWLRDSDIVVVPKTAVQRNDEFIEQVFTKGLYGVIPEGIISSLIFNQGASF